MLNRMPRDMLPDMVSKCKTRCTFIRFVHRSLRRRTGGRQTGETRSGTCLPAVCADATASDPFGRRRNAASELDLNPVTARHDGTEVEDAPARISVMVSRFRVLSPAGRCAVPLCSRRPAERILEILLRTLAVAPVIVAWAAQDPEFLRPGQRPQGTRPRMAKAPAGASRIAGCQVRPAARTRELRYWRRSGLYEHHRLERSLTDRLGIVKSVGKGQGCSKRTTA
jgi:hypothetical protein